jgi:hypothetical protein
MSEINVNKTDSIQTHSVDSSASISNKGGSIEEFYNHPFIQEMMQLLKASGLPEVVQASALSEAIMDPHNAKTLEDYQAVFQNHSLKNSDFATTFQNFCAEQLFRKGEFKSIEGFSDWNSYVKEQATLESDVKTLIDDMKGIANDPAQQKKIVDLEADVKKMVDDIPGATDDMQAATSEQVQQKETVEFELQRDPFASLNMIIEVLMDLLVCAQKLASTYAASLDTQTMIQSGLIDQQSKSLQPLSVADLPEDMQDDETYTKMVENYNAYTLPAAQDLNRSYRSNSEDISEALNSSINMSIQDASKLSDDISEILNKLSSMVASLR